MNQMVRLDVLSYELGVLAALSYLREDLAIKDSLESILNAIDQKQLHRKCFLDGFKTELTDKDGNLPTEEVVVDILLKYLDVISDFVREDDEEMKSSSLLGRAKAIAEWASCVFSEVTDYEVVDESDISFEQIGVELEQYCDLDESDIEGAINLQIQAAGYRYSMEECCWIKE